MWSVSSVQWLSHVCLFATPWTAACQASLFIANSWSLFRFMSFQSVMPSSHFIFCRPFSVCLQSFQATGSFLIRQFFKSGGQTIRVSYSKEYSGLIPFRIDWLDLLAVQGTLKSLLQNHSSKASILICSAFFIVQLSDPYMTTGKAVALTKQTFVGKATSLLFNMCLGWS